MSTQSNTLSSKTKAPAEAITLVATPIALTPAPGPDRASAKAAVKRCCAAWQRAVKAYTEEFGGPEIGFFGAPAEGGKAYCHAMPVLSGIDGIHDFLACAAHGILIGAIPADRGGQTLYAAQVALNALHFEPKPPRQLSK